MQVAVKNQLCQACALSSTYPSHSAPPPAGSSLTTNCAFGQRYQTITQSSSGGPHGAWGNDGTKRRKGEKTWAGTSPMGHGSMDDHDPCAFMSHLFFSAASLLAQRTGSRMGTPPPSLFPPTHCVLRRAGQLWRTGCPAHWFRFCARARASGPWLWRRVGSTEILREMDQSGSYAVMGNEHMSASEVLQYRSSASESSISGPDTC